MSASRQVLSPEPMAETGAVASVDGLRKRYKDVEAVRGLSFDLRPGEIFGLLGPNGAGKTTTIEIMEGLRPYDSGTVRVLGLDPWRQSLELKERIGAALQNTVFPDKVTVMEVLRLYAGFYARHADLRQLVDRFDLASKKDAVYESLSGGQKQRLALALALVNGPDLVFLDEPTAGLDAQVRRDLHEVILALRADGKTVLLTTHYIEEAERLCDRVAIVAQGELRALGSPAELRARASRQTRVDAAFHTQVAASDLDGLDAVSHVDAVPGGAALATSDAAATVSALVHRLDSLGTALSDIRITRPTLEDLYLELTGNAGMEEENA